MKTLFSLLLLVSIIACTNDAPLSPTVPTQTGYSKLIFDYIDGSFEETAIKSVSYKPNSLRTTAAVLVVDKEITIQNGSYDVIEMKDGGRLRITGSVSTLNLNFLTNSLVKIIIDRDAKLFINSSLNLDTRVQITNTGELTSGSVELQGEKAEILNRGYHYIRGDLQMNGPGAYYENSGIVEVSNFTSVHAGQLKFIDCTKSALITGGLNVDSAKKIIGEGYIKVLGNANINAMLTESCDIMLCVTGNIPASKLGAAVRTCDPKCVPVSLPVKIYDLAIAKTSPTELSVSFKVTENTDLNVMRVLYSTDAKTWRTVATVQPDKLIVGEEFKGVYSLSEK